MHPPKLLIMFPIYTPVEYRRQLTALDDALVVHHHADGRFQLDLRAMIRLTTRGQRSFGAALRQLAADLEAGYCVIIVERDQYLADLERLARANATSRDRDAIERAVQIVMERIDRQVFDNLFDSPREYLVGRMLTARQPRRTKANKHETPGLNCMFGIPTPRTELPVAYPAPPMVQPAHRLCRAAWRGITGAAPIALRCRRRMPSDVTPVSSSIWN